MKTFVATLCLTLALVACTPKTVPTNSLKDYGRLNGGEVTDAVHGKQTALFYGALAGENGVNANGVAYIRVYADGASAVTVNLNIEMAPEGSSYIARLENDDGSKNISIGELRSIVGDVRHAVSLDTNEDTSNLHTVSIYRGSTLVAEGTLKAPATPQ